VDAYGLVLTIVVLLAIGVAILLFEKRRATRIERDLKQMAQEQRRHPPTDGSADGRP
jgi:hypothetical protein